ncbi:MAG TPA: ABC transporter permease [Acidobacteriaceae bacterium]|nr:ABC transporter permease [Acidobacteriaceae bacterium]
MELTTQLKQVLRRLLRAPMFTMVTLITLALGIGATIAVFSVVEGVLLKPLPYPHPEQLVGVWHTAPGLNLDDVNMAPSNYFIYREQNRAFTDIGIYQGDSVSVTGQGSPERITAIDVTDGIFPVLGIAPMLGRTFSKADVAPGAPQTVVLGYGYWQRHFGGDRSVIGRSITADGKIRQIIGVMPRNFRFLDWTIQPGVYLPLQFDRNKTKLGQFSYEGIARLRPGQTIETANTDVARMLPMVWTSFPAPEGFSIELFRKARIGPKIRPLMRDVIGDVGQTLWILLGSIGIVLLIACANVANLMLVRAEGRHQELAICSALGASRWRVMQEFLLESAVIGVAGAALGLALAWGAVHLLTALAPAGLPRLGDIGIDLPVLGFAVLLALLCSLLFGSIPAFRYGHVSAGTGLREGGRSLSQGRERHRTRNTLVVVQVGLAFVLLICSGLMIRTFRALNHVNPGFDVAGIQTLHIDIPEAEVSDPVQVMRMQETMQHNMAAVPGVTSVSISTSVPLDDGHWMDPVFAQDHSYASGQLPPLRRFRFVTPGFFRTMGIPMIAGRDYTWDEIYQKVPVAIVSEDFAREYWGSPQKALGQRIRVASTDDWREIVGVVGDTYDDGISKEAPKIAYWPLLRNNFEGDKVNIQRWVTFVVRSERAGSESLAGDLRRAIWSVDSNLPVSDVRTEEFLYAKSLARTSFTLVMIGIAAVIALLLGLVGLYGVIAYSASQRRREIGIRIAVGAQRNDITGMFVRQGLLLAGIGVLCGFGVALGVTRLLGSLLFHVSPMDPVTYASACLALVGAAALASYLPSRRTASVDPVEALRAE